MASSSPRKSLHRSRSSRHSSSKPHKTEILINVYDLLPPGKLSTTLWHLGSPLLHTGIVITSLNREYAFGALFLPASHPRSKPNATGVYHTPPGLEPEDARFRCSLLQGVSFLSPAELEGVVKDVSHEFKGAEYNLLTNNCNHFSSKLCARLTGKEAPRWMNRAAGIGVALPCLVPREWIGPTEHEVDSEDAEEGHERRELMRQKATDGPGNLKGKMGAADGIMRRRSSGAGGEGKVGGVRDEEGRCLPASEVTPLLRTVH
ncbi:MAG: hypothetical protein Q9182_005671 [Xanthomendoza sp. 2 TL-2023]